ncbi:MAG: hypothetical protein ACI9XJ_002509, partial [Marivirga sp.]
LDEMWVNNCFDVFMFAVFLFIGLSGCASSTRVSYRCARIVFNDRLKN